MAGCDEPQDRYIWLRKKGCYCTLLLVRVENAVLGDEFLCHRFGKNYESISKKK